MKEALQRNILEALESLGLAEGLGQQDIELSRPKNPGHGDWSCNIALRLASKAGRNPRELAEGIVEALPPMAEVGQRQVAGPGFINFHLRAQSLNQVLAEIITLGDEYGRKPVSGDTPKTLLEYLSTNPTGPLHIGHGRIAVFGSALAEVLRAAGHDVHTEYYVNDAGRQIGILALSALLRAAQALAGKVEGLEVLVARAQEWDVYRGGYLEVIAEELAKQGWMAEARLEELRICLEKAMAAREGEDDDTRLDGCILALAEVWQERWHEAQGFVVKRILEDIVDDLENSRIVFDGWFSERSLLAKLDEAVAQWRAHEDVYEREGALWFAATRHGDDKDRVLLRRNGSPTYFAMDLLYHGDKLARGYQRLVNVFGADHHGYVTRLRTAVEVFFSPPSPVEARLAQFVRLHKDGELEAMSTRSGDFITFRDLREKIGVDVVRFYFLLSEADQGLDFDLELAVSQSNDNPLYYVQYACVRCRQALAKSAARQPLDEAQGKASLALLERDSERDLIAQLARYPEVLERAAKALEPAILIRYARDVAQSLHANYGDVPYIVEDDALRNARLMMVKATLQTLSNALALLRVSVPERM